MGNMQDFGRDVKGMRRKVRRGDGKEIFRKI